MLILMACTMHLILHLSPARLLVHISYNNSRHFNKSVTDSSIEKKTITEIITIAVVKPFSSVEQHTITVISL